VRMTMRSFCGGAGGNASDAAVPTSGVAAPEPGWSSGEDAPSGPRGSSTASRRVGWATRRRGPRTGPREVGERMDDDAWEVDAVEERGFEDGSSACEVSAVDAVGCDTAESAHGVSSRSIGLGETLVVKGIVGGRV
jgi:hypothetical protein